MNDDLENMDRTIARMYASLSHQSPQPDRSPSDRKTIFGLSMLLLAILTATFGLYFDVSSASFYRYMFWGFSVAMMLVAGWHIDSSNSQRDELRLSEIDLPELADRDPDSPSQGQGSNKVRRVK